MFPTIAQAHQILHQAGQRNPGPWVEHSKVAAAAAHAIAEHHPTLEADRAYVLALLHDIGRGNGGPGVADVRHVLDGYQTDIDHGFDDCAESASPTRFP